MKRMTIEELEREFESLENNSFEHSEEDWLGVLELVESMVRSSTMLFSDSARTSRLISRMSCFLASSAYVDLKKIKYIKYLQSEHGLNVYDALGKNVFAPFWIEAQDPDFTTLVYPAVYARRAYAIDHFGGLGLSSRRIDKELADKFKKLSAASRTILGRSSSIEVFTSKTLRHSLDRLRKNIMASMPNEYHDIPFATSVLEDRVTQEILRIGDMEKDHPGMLAALHGAML